MADDSTNDLYTMVMRLIEDEEEFKLKAYAFYDNPQAISLKEFKEDFKRFKYTKNLIEKYKTAYSHGTQLVDERLILNHITILHNLFGNFASVGLFSRVDSDYWYILKTFLVFLNIMPRDFDTRNQIKIDEKLMGKLENL
jgi:hypothetical protein